MPHSQLLLQLVIILAVARALGWVLRWFGQPAVIGEMAAGIVLGPIVFGAWFPEFHAHVFAPESLGPLRGLSQLGLVLFMFIVGAELRLPRGAGEELKAAGWVGTLSVLLPMALGVPVGLWLHPMLAPAAVGLWPFTLFIAAAMSITAFPVMARILKDRDMTRSPIGQLSLTSAAVADVLAWILLALVVVLASSKSSWRDFATQMTLLLALVFVVFVIVRPLLARAITRFAGDGKPEGALLALLLVGTFACAWATEWLHVHAVFGAFLFGAALPRDDRLLATLIERIEHVAVIVLMPIFFALAGLGTTADAFGAGALVALVLILFVSVAGKLVGATLGARIARRGWRSSLAVGSLMNARGLMELIVIKVGLDIGVIGADVFTMLLVMAIVTTVMTVWALPRSSSETC